MFDSCIRIGIFRLGADSPSIRSKPTIIAESTPFGGIELRQASNDTKTYLAKNAYIQNDWDRWYGIVLDLINEYDISMWCYINCDWESQPMWHNVGFGETRLSSNPHVMSQWHKQIIKNGNSGRTFLGSGSLDNCGAGRTGPMEMDESKSEANEKVAFGLNHFYSFILVPFLVASGAFFVPYFILGGHKKSRHGSPERERRPLLSNMDDSIRTSPAQLSGHKKMASIDGIA